jgi:hypothetical protein
LLHATAEVVASASSITTESRGREVTRNYRPLV